jgi:hypothetical protein
MSYEYAEDAISKGYRVLPVSPTTKQPYTDTWCWSNDPEQVATWWNVDYPDAVVGIDLAHSCVAVVDIDNHEGKVSGFDTLKNADLKLPVETLFKEKSLSGKGEHHWYVNPGIDKSGKLPGIDIKVTGYVIANYFVPAPEDIIVSLPSAYHTPKSMTPEGIAWEGTIQDWIDLYSGYEVSPEVTDVVEDLRLNGFTGNELLFKKMIRLVHLAIDGRGGVPEAMRELFSIWMANKHSSGDPKAEFIRAMQRAITLLGGGKIDKTAEEIADAKQEELLAKAELLAESWEVKDLALRLRAQKYATGTREIQWDELEAMQVDWIIDGVLAYNNNTMLVGAPNIGKTFLYIDWMCASIAGLHWAGRETKRATFMVVIGEGATGWSDRIKAWCDENMEDYNEIRKHIIPMSQASLASDSDIDLMAEIVRDRGVDIVVFDTWNTNSGLSDENSNGEAALSLNAMNRLKTGVLIVHHPNAETQNEIKLKPRGATALAGKMDFIVTMFQTCKDSKFSGVGAKYITISTLDENGGKSRHSERLSTQGFWLKDVNKTKVMVHDNGSIYTNINSFFATALKDGPMSLDDLEEWSKDNWDHNGKLGVTARTIRTWAKDAKAGCLQVSATAKGKKMYTWSELPEWTPHN